MQAVAPIFCNANKFSTVLHAKALIEFLNVNQKYFYFSFENKIYFHTLKSSQTGRFIVGS